MIFWSKKPEPIPTIYTQEKCESCGKKARRLFEKGDHVYKQSRECNNCGSTMLITSVYAEYPQEKP